MPDQTSTIISKVWGMCGPLRDDGVSYGDYLEQLTYLIFLKMSDEYAKPPNLHRGHGFRPWWSACPPGGHENYRRPLLRERRLPTGVEELVPGGSSISY